MQKVIDDDEKCIPSTTISTKNWLVSASSVMCASNQIIFLSFNANIKYFPI